MYAITLQVNEGGSHTLYHQRVGRQITRKSNIDNTFRRSQDTTIKIGGKVIISTMAKNMRKKTNTVDLCETIKKGNQRKT